MSNIHNCGIEDIKTDGNHSKWWHRFCPHCGEDFKITEYDLKLYCEILEKEVYGRKYYWSVGTNNQNGTEYKEEYGGWGYNCITGCRMDIRNFKQFLKVHKIISQKKQGKKE